MALLDGNRSNEEQEKGLELARKVECINVFLQPCIPKYNKNVWDNCAKVLAEKTDEELRCCLTQLFEWIEDLNWPGAMCIFERLQRYEDKTSFACVFNSCVTRAYLTKNMNWLGYLMKLKKLEDYLYKEAVLGELLYSLANREKGRTPTGIWTKKYRQSLMESLDIMEQLIHLLNHYADITVEEVIPILVYAKKQYGYCINLIDIEKLIQQPSKVIFAKELQLNPKFKSEECKEVEQLMVEIVSECKLLLEQKGKKNKRKIVYLLRGLHNLPKIYLNPERISFCNLAMKEISPNQALEYSQFDLEMAKKW